MFERYTERARRVTKKPELPTSIDMPLSLECKRILAYAAEEAERLRHDLIGTEHLLLGMLREENCVAAQILQERGLKPEAIRGELASLPRPVRHKPNGPSWHANQVSNVSLDLRHTAARMRLRTAFWVLFMVAAAAAAIWLVLGPWTPRNGTELLAVMLFSMGSPVGGFWMIYRSIRCETKPLRYILLAFVPMSFLWYYVERVRSSSARRPELRTLRN